MEPEDELPVWNFTSMFPLTLTVEKFPSSVGPAVARVPEAVMQGLPAFAAFFAAFPLCVRFWMRLPSSTSPSARQTSPGGQDGWPTLAARASRRASRKVLAAIPPAGIFVQACPVRAQKR